MGVRVRNRLGLGWRVRVRRAVSTDFNGHNT